MCPSCVQKAVPGQACISARLSCGNSSLFLPEGVLAKDSLSVWREQLLAEGFAIRTVNCRVSTVSALLEAMDCREFQVDRQLRPPQFEAPELTRQEYLRML